jgi:hypothetical protein
MNGEQGHIVTAENVECEYVTYSGEYSWVVEGLTN